MTVPPEGGCACGEVRYRVTSDPLFTHCCHCLNCQRQTGSAFVINVLIGATTYVQLPVGTVVAPRERLRVKGKDDPIDAYLLLALP